MSGITKLMTAGGGGVALTPASSIASDVTVQVPSVNDTLVGLAATQTLTNKTLTTPNIDSAQVATVSGTAPLYMCRAWVNFNGAASYIRSSGNVSSVTHNGTGDYTVNFTNAMPDGNYSVVGTCEKQGPTGYYGKVVNTLESNPPTVTSCRVCTEHTGGGTSNEDKSYVCLSIFR